MNTLFTVHLFVCEVGRLSVELGSVTLLVHELHTASVSIQYVYTEYVSICICICIKDQCPRALETNEIC
jgi:hypothetical protein